MATNQSTTGPAGARSTRQQSSQNGKTAAAKSGQVVPFTGPSKPSPKPENRKVTPRRLPNAALRSREYLTQDEVDLLIAAARDSREPFGLNPRLGLLLSHAIRRRQRPDQTPLVDLLLLERVIGGEILAPNAIEQVENLIIWLGENCEYPGQLVDIRYENFQAIIGRHKGSNLAFMAMEYNTEPLQSIVNDHFRPAVKQAGFELRLLSDDPKAGIIDNRLRVEIRRSRIMIADLSHGNNGAYWEAGFGEGLGLPAIYTCERFSLDERKVHFDTRNSQIVVWDKGSPGVAAEELKATIRNSLPDEAILTD